MNAYAGHVYARRGNVALMLGGLLLIHWILWFNDWDVELPILALVLVDAVGSAVFLRTRREPS